MKQGPFARFWLPSVGRRAKRALDDQDIMAAAGPGDGQEVETVVNRKPACPRNTSYNPLGPEMVRTLFPVLY